MKTQNKPSISDVARQNNTAKVSKFAKSIIPAAPEQNSLEQKPELTPKAEPQNTQLTDIIKRGEADYAAGKVTTYSVEQLEDLEAQLTTPTPAPVAKPARKRSGSLSMDDIIGVKAPDEETFSKMTRIAEKHHDLLREIAFRHRKPMNTILYNLLEVLDQTYQREQRNHA